MLLQEETEINKKLHYLLREEQFYIWLGNVLTQWQDALTCFSMLYMLKCWALATTYNSYSLAKMNKS
jgi:hypothetical protein